jgi:hypothetical protein
MDKFMQETIATIKFLISERRFEECEALISTAMFENPHSAVPHNLMGLMLEEKNCHTQAMNHFRAAWALDPTYKPAAWNLNCFGTVFRTCEPVYTDSEFEVMEREGKKNKAGMVPCTF